MQLSLVSEIFSIYRSITLPTYPLQAPPQNPILDPATCINPVASFLGVTCLRSNQSEADLSHIIRYVGRTPAEHVLG